MFPRVNARALEAKLGAQEDCCAILVLDFHALDCILCGAEHSMVVPNLRTVFRKGAPDA